MAKDKHFRIVTAKGIFEFPGDKTVYIGETEGCDIRLDNHTEYEDEIICRIVPDEGGEGWHLVRMTPYFTITAGGRKVNRVAYLNEKDTINIGRETLKFREVSGEKHATTIQRVNRTPGWVLASILILVVTLGALVGWSIYESERETLTRTMISEIEQSVVGLRVDSIQLLFCNCIVETYQYDTPPTGTAFITTDSLLVTARHCIEPWLNMVDPLDYAKLPENEEWPVANALMAETDNQLVGWEHWSMVSYITVFDDANKAVMTLTSDDFKVNREFDEIVELGSYDNPQYWRSISHRYNRKDMMLGDVASARIGKSGTLRLASETEIRNLLSHKGVKLTFFGYPEAGVTGSRLETKRDEMRLPLEELPETPGRLFLITHEGGLTPGYSGGPAVVRDGMNYRVVGVISVTDEKNGYRSYSVPATEVNRKK